MSVGSQIRLWRQTADMTITALAESVGCHRNTIANYEKGASNPSSTELSKIANALGCSISALIAEPPVKPPKFHTSYTDETEEFFEADQPDPINPAHYKSHPSGIECIEITEHLMNNVGCAIAYLWRHGQKGDAIEDLRKARWYVDREIQRLERQQDAALRESRGQGDRA